MKCLLLSVVVLAAIHATFGTPTLNDFDNPLHLILRDDSSPSIIGNTGKVIQELVNNLKKAAEQVSTAMSQFQSGMQEQFKAFTDRIVQDLQKLRDRVNKTMESITSKFTNTGSAVKECVDTNKQEISKIFNDSTADTITCANEKIRNVGNSIEKLRNLSQEAHTSAAEALDSMKTCTESHPNSMMSTGGCMGAIILQTEIKQAGFLAKSGLLISSINVGLATLPGALEVCAGGSLLKVGTETSKVLAKLATCSASNGFSAMTGNHGSEVQKP